MSKQALCAAALTLVFTACSGAGAGLPTGAIPPAQSAAAIAQAKHKGTARFEIKIPKKKKRRRERYVSPATKSLQIAITPVGGGQPVTKKINVSGATLQVAIQLNPGKYLATVATYDAINEGGNRLSSGQALPFELAAGKDTTVTLVLGGVLHAFDIVPDSAPGSVAGGFSIYGSTAQAFTVAGTDADGYLIIGPGAPLLNISITGTGWSVTPKQTSAANPDRFAVTPPGVNASTATVKLAVADPALCALAGSACTTTFGLKNISQKLYAAVCQSSCGVSTNPDEVVIFDAPYTGQPVATITNGILGPTDVAADKSGNVFVVNNPLKYGGNSSTPPSVTEYSPTNNYASPIATMTSGLEYPTRIALNPSGDVIVMNGMPDTYDYPAIFTAASHYAGAPITIKMDLSQAVDMRVNAQGTIVVASCGVSCDHPAFNDEIVQFPEPYSSTETPTDFSTVDPLSLTIDPLGNLWVGECQGCTVQASDVVEHLPQPGTPYLYSSSIENLADQADYIDGPVAIAVDANKNLFIADAQNGNYPGIAKYTAPYTATPTALFGGQVIARQLQVDQSDELVMDQDISSLEVSLPPYSTYTPVIDEFNDAPVYGELTRFSLSS
jgi:hypothetical protein